MIAFFKKNYRIILPVFLFLASAVLRFWKVPELYYFGIDEEYQTYLATTIVKDFHIRWIGLAAGSTGFYVGPGLIYFQALLQWIWDNPVFLGYSASGIGVLTTIVIYIVTNKLFNFKTAVIATILYTFSAFTNSYDRHFWNPTFVPLISVLMFYVYSQSIKNPKWLIGIGFLLGVIFHIHASLFIFVPLSIGLFIYLTRIHKKIPGKTILLSLGIFLMLISPLIVFDMVHNFDNLKTPIRMIEKNDGTSSFDLINHIEIITSALTKSLYFEIFTIPVYISLNILIISSFIFFIIKKRDSTESLLLFIIVSFIFFLIIFPGVIHRYYLVGLVPLFMIMSSIMLARFNIFILSVLMIIFVGFNLFSISRFPEDHGLSARKKLIEQTFEIIGNKSYELRSDGPYLHHGGWRHLFSYYGHQPLQSDADSMFGWIYPEEISSEKSELRIVISNNITGTIPEEKPAKSFSDKTYTVYIFDLQNDK